MDYVNQANLQSHGTSNMISQDISGDANWNRVLNELPTDDLNTSLNLIEGDSNCVYSMFNLLRETPRT